MPQLHLYVSDEDASRIRARAAAEGLSVSRYLAQVVLRDDTDGWPAGWLEAVVGGWQGEPLKREPTGPFQERDPF